MSTAMLRTAGLEFDVNAFLQRFPIITPDNVWHRGEGDRAKRVRNESGFSIAIAESESLDEVVELVTRFLTSRSDLIKDLAACGASSVIDVSLEVGSSEHYTSSILFKQALLRLFAALGVELEISGYPAADE